MFRIAIVSREPTGLATDVAAASALLAGVAEVTVLTSEQVEVEDELDNYYGPLHLWSSRAFERLKELFPDGGPELIEFAGSPAEAVVAVQARLTLDPWLGRTLVLLRPRVTRELGAVLDGAMPNSLGARVELDLERYALAHADRLLVSGPEALRGFERFYERLCPAVVAPPAVAPGEEGPPPQPGDRLRLLCAAPLSRRHGVERLLRAVSGLDRDDWSLTLAGADTLTGSLETSMRAQLELAAEGDPRVSFGSEEHDVVVAPAVWDAWPSEALPALSRNRPLLATPVGGHVDILRDGGGWLSEDLAAAIERLLEDPGEVERMRQSREPRRRFEELADPEPMRAAYAKLAHEAVPSRRHRRAEPPLVSIVVTYFELDDYVEEAVASIFEQTHPRIEALIVNDGSFRPEDAILEELASRYPIAVLVQPRGGVGAARNFGVVQTRGRYVFMLDADNVATPTFVERCVEVLEERPEVAYVSSWLEFIDQAGEPARDAPRGYQPVSNECSTLDRVNTAGDAAAVVRRRVFDLGFRYSADSATHDDWLLYRELGRAGHYGHVIPERLLRYRVRPDSMTQTIGDPRRYNERARELEAIERRQELEWA